jgi:hypothetical protein
MISLVLLDRLAVALIDFLGSLELGSLTSFQRAQLS